MLLEIVVAIGKYVVMPILLSGLVVAPLVAIIWHRHVSKPAPQGREFVSAHPVKREGDRY